MRGSNTASLSAGGVQAHQLENLLQISIELSATQDRQKMLGTILTEARRLTRAQAGTFYIRRGNELEFAVAQNDAVDASKITRVLLGQKLRIGAESLAGFVASTAQAVSVPSTYRLASSAPFRIHRDFDSQTGYRALTVLAVPLKCPDGEVVGVLQLFNRVGPGGAIEAFPDEPEPAVLSLASLAAVEVHNVLLSDRLKEAHLDTIIRLSMAAEFRDRHTAEHIQRISSLSGLIAMSFGWTDDQVELIRYASPMHDVGKIAIPDSILLKTGPLTPEERSIVERHPLVGAEILDNPTNDLMSMAHEIALFHHERWDGNG